MDRNQLVSLVAAMLAARTEKADLDAAVKNAEELIRIVDTRKHVPKSDWNGKVKKI
ncbi:MAG TPA: hypothetical protein VEH50_02145 [Methylomirabilota bacterium]|nr:hypothetical protein [Methylomirabilota bacterium]